MSSPRFESFLARLYSDSEFLGRFMRAPEEVSREAGLNQREQAAAAAIDRAGLLMAARSYELKRGARRPGSRRGSLANRSVAGRWLRWGF
jgi:hypothetical protein